MILAVCNQITASELQVTVSIGRRSCKQIERVNRTGVVIDIVVISVGGLWGEFGSSWLHTPVRYLIIFDLAGLAGLTYYCGYSNIMEMGKMPNEGFDGIAVALLGNCSPVGVFFSAVFFGILKMGRGSLAATGIPTEIADTIIATIIYFTATSVILANFWNRRFHNAFEKTEEAIGLALESKGRSDVDLTTLSSQERKNLRKAGLPLLKARTRAGKEGR